MKIILATHGDFCFGIKKSYEMLAGHNDAIIPVTLSDSDTGEFKKELNEIVNSDEKFLILCDIYGGTPFNESVYLEQKYPSRVKTVGGLNLAMLLETGMAVNSELNLSEIFNMAVNTGIESIKGLDDGGAITNDEDMF